MRFNEIPVSGAFIVEPEARSDERGLFSRLWCRDELAGRGLSGEFVQCNDSVSACAGTLRGLHFQLAPHEEVKLVRCVRGAIFDVLVDLRPASSSYLRWVGVELTARERSMVYAPRGCAHGYLTLEDDTEVVYAVTAPYQPSAERGVRWNDPLFGICWPIPPTIISEKDRAWPDYAR